MRRLPPLAAVRVFEAAARHENFRAAASELAMTQAAVSYQIKALELWLGISLFHRERKRVRLTEQGRAAAAQSSSAFDLLEDTFSGIRVAGDRSLTISTPQTLASNWLSSRIGRLAAAHPQLAVRLIADDRLTDFADGVDAAIRIGRGDWPGLRAEQLIAIDFTPMCSPDFLKQQGGQLTLDEVPCVPRIGPADPYWTAWLAQAGVAIDDGPLAPGLGLATQAHQGAAAIGGHGLALLTPFLWQGPLQAGQLVQPFDQIATIGEHYWLVYPEGRRTATKLRQFRSWLLSEFAADRR